MQRAISEKGVGNIGENHPDSIGASFTQAAGRIIGLIVEFFGDRKYFFVVLALTRYFPPDILFMTNDTNATETPAASAISLIVVLRFDAILFE